MKILCTEEMSLCLIYILSFIKNEVPCYMYICD